MYNIKTLNKISAIINTELDAEKYNISDSLENYEGIPIQNVREAILVSQHIIMLNRLLDAVEVAKEKNLIPALDGERIIKELYKND